MAGIIVAVALLAVAQLAWTGGPRFPVDDAYITLHNARALDVGTDTSFPNLSPLYGATSVVHLGLVAALGKALPAAWALWTAGWLAVLLYAGGVVRLARLFGLGPASTLGLVVVAMGAGEVALQLMNGLETGLALAALTWTLALLSDPDERRRRWLPFLAGQLPFLRPELGLLAAFVLVESSLRAPKGRRWPLFLRSTAWAAIAASPWLISYWLATGSFLPPTISAKRNFFAEGCVGSDWKLSTVVGETWSFLAFLGAAALGFLLLPLRRVGALALLYAGCFLAAYYFEFPGALGHFEHRYLTILQPLALFGLLLGLASSRQAVRRGSSVLLALAAVGSLVTLPRALSRYGDYLDNQTKSSEEAAAFIRERLPADAKLLVHDIGYLSAFVPQQLVDLVGLKSPRAAALHRRVTWPTCGDARVLVVNELALDLRPGYFVVLDEWDRIYDLTHGLSVLGWGLEPLRPLGVAYQVYRLSAPRAPVRLPPNVAGEPRSRAGAGSRP